MTKTLDQMELVDLFDNDNGPVWDEEVVRLDELPDTGYVTVRRDLRDSIAEIGVLVPILVAKHGKHLTIIDGRHRVAAARDAGEVNIPARVTDMTQYGDAALTLIANAQRSPNVVAEYDAIVKLMKDGSNEHDVARLTGIPVGTIRKRLKIASLNSDLMTRFRKGEMSGPAAEAAAALPRAHQTRLAEATADMAKVRYRDVHDVRQVVAASAAAALPSDIFGARASEAEQTTKSTPSAPEAVSAPNTGDQGYIARDANDARGRIIAVATIAIDNNSTKGELLKALEDIRALAQQM